jgi:hypothetical protein
MGKVLKEYQSASNPGKQYHIIRGEDGVTYCDCPAWRFNSFNSSDRTCKHLKDYLAGPNKVYNTFHQGKTYTADTQDDLARAIEMAVQELS